MQVRCNIFFNSRLNVLSRPNIRRRSEVAAGQIGPGLNPRSETRRQSRFKSIIDSKLIPGLKFTRSNTVKRKSEFASKVSLGMSLNKKNKVQGISMDHEKLVRRFYGVENEESSEVDNDSSTTIINESEVGRVLSNSIIRNSIMLLLFTILCGTAMESTTWDSGEDVAKGEVISFFGPLLENSKDKDYWRDNLGKNLLILKIEQLEDSSSPILLYHDSHMEYYSPTLPTRRSIEKIVIYHPNLELQMSLILDRRTFVMIQALLNIIRIILCTIAFNIFVQVLTKDTQKLLILPLERIRIKVANISRNPMLVKHEILEDESDNNEADIIGNAILKIATLLMLVFGPAGSNILIKYIDNGGNGASQINSGELVYAIYGFCDIRSFTDTTEVLQEGVMLFVNEIADIIHSVVDQHLGANNKNIGDAFLLVWKFRDGLIEDNGRGGLRVKPQDMNEVSALVDLSLTAIIKCIAMIEKSPSLRKYNEDRNMQQKIPGYRVTLGFGLHIGWSIEGPIGSSYKIDLSYLSPHVSLASTLEEMTKLYETPILFTETLYNLLSQMMHRYCRLIDSIKFKSQEWPLSLYTVEIRLGLLRSAVNNFDAPLLARECRAFLSLQLSKKKEHIMGYILSEKTGADKFNFDLDLKLCVHIRDRTYRSNFNRALDAYFDGDWETSYSELTSVLNIDPEDGPAKFLFNYIKTRLLNADVDWEGHRNE